MGVTVQLIAGGKNFLGDHFNFDCSITQNPILDEYSVDHDTKWRMVLEVSKDQRLKFGGRLGE